MTVGCGDGAWSAITPLDGWDDAEAYESASARDAVRWKPDTAGHGPEEQRAGALVIKNDARRVGVGRLVSHHGHPNRTLARPPRHRGDCPEDNSPVGREAPQRPARSRWAGAQQWSARRAGPSRGYRRGDRLGPFRSGLRPACPRAQAAPSLPGATCGEIRAACPASALQNNCSVSGWRPWKPAIGRPYRAVRVRPSRKLGHGAWLTRAGGAQCRVLPFPGSWRAHSCIGSNARL